MPIEIRQAPATTPSAGLGERLAAIQLRRHRVRPRDRMFFTERLALLLETGVPLHQSLQSLASQVASPAMQPVLAALSAEVGAGNSFSQALARHPDVFPRTYVSLVAAAEVGGFLPSALERLRDLEERRQELQSALSSALSYPALLLCFSTAVVIFVLVVVFPKFEDLFALIHDQLPVTTRWLMAASNVLRRWWLPGAVFTAGAALLIQSWLKRPEGAEMADRLALRLPLVRDIVIQMNLVQLLRVMGLALANGVNLVEALRSARDTLSSPHFRRFSTRLEERVNEGQDFASGFESDPLVPDLVKQMVGTGDQSGQLAAVMGRLADFYEREWRRALGVIAKVAEPFMLLVMGGVVGLIVSSLILPIFKLSRAVH